VGFFFPGNPMRSKTIRTVLITGCLLVVIIGIGGLVFRGEIRQSLNSFRADRLMQKAEVAFAQEDWADATRLGTAAHYLDTDNPAIDLLVARALLKQRNPSAVAWWQRVLMEPDLPRDELWIVTQAILRRGDVQEGMPFLNRLMELDGDNPETQRLWLYSLGLQRRFGSAQAYAEQMDLYQIEPELEPVIEQGIASDETDDAEQPEQSTPSEINLAVAVETATADETEALASTLSVMGEWILLQRLMENRLREDPANPEYLVKLIGAYYYAGDAAPLPPLLEKLKRGSLESQPVWESFIYYLHLLIDGFNPDSHMQLEAMLARYPEVFEYRLVLGLSFLLNGQPQLARGLVEDMPDLPPATARHLRVIAIILGMPADTLLLPGERDQLLPRERFLISQARIGNME
jgi:hypothetical protein